MFIILHYDNHNNTPSAYGPYDTKEAALNDVDESWTPRFVDVVEVKTKVKSYEERCLVCGKPTGDAPDCDCYLLEEEKK
jgi:hypothetical protein